MRDKVWPWAAAALVLGALTTSAWSARASKSLSFCEFNHESEFVEAAEITVDDLPGTLADVPSPVVDGVDLIDAGFSTEAEELP